MTIDDWIDEFGVRISDYGLLIRLTLGRVQDTLLHGVDSRRVGRLSRFSRDHAGRALALQIAACAAAVLVGCSDHSEPRRRATGGAFPATDDLQLHFVRTDFSDDRGWAEVLSEVSSQYGMFRADILPVDDRRFDGLTVERLLQVVPPDQEPFYVFLVDRETLTRADHPVLVVNLFEPRGRSFRVIPSVLWSVQANLALANMDWEDFTVALDGDGVFRGFRQ